MIVSHAVFIGFCTFVTATVAFGWMVFDALRLRRVVRVRPRTPQVRDHLFGSIMGVVCGLVGVIGMLREHL